MLGNQKGKTSSITKYRIQKLEGVGFQWEKLEFGHTRVPTIDVPLGP